MSYVEDIYTITLIMNIPPFSLVYLSYCLKHNQNGIPKENSHFETVKIIQTANMQYVLACSFLIDAILTLLVHSLPTYLRC